MRTQAKSAASAGSSGEIESEEGNLSVDEGGHEDGPAASGSVFEAGRAAEADGEVRLAASPPHVCLASAAAGAIARGGRAPRPRRSSARLQVSGGAVRVQPSRAKKQRMVTFQDGTQTTDGRSASAPTGSASALLSQHSSGKVGALQGVPPSRPCRRDTCVRNTEIGR